MHLLVCGTLGLAGALTLSPRRTEAQATLLQDFGGPLGFGTQCMGANDDASSEAIDLSATFPGGLRWGDRRFYTLYVNNNGNVSLGEPLGEFTPAPFDYLAIPVIAPYWVDLDSRPSGCGAELDAGKTPACPAGATDNVVWWHQEPTRLVVTWYRMGRYQCDGSSRVSAQLEIVASGCTAAGDFDLVFRNAECGFTSGDASKAEGQVIHAQVGFGGAEVAFEELDGSRTASIDASACRGGEEPGVHRYAIRSLADAPQQCVGAGEMCDTGRLGVCSAGARSCELDGPTCVALQEARAERCDGLDNDCDGQVDESHDCSEGGCVAGSCAPFCSEGLCPSGLVCEGRYCVRRACVDIECAEGSFCRDGSCVDSCEGVYCPLGQSCLDGRCQDLCERIRCDSTCEVCQNGSCIPRCVAGDCEPGYDCIAGRCEPSACRDVSCASGLHCVSGVCEPACERVRCPRGYTCWNGQCDNAEKVEQQQLPPGVLRNADEASCRVQSNCGWPLIGLLMIALAVARARGSSASARRA